jgi:acetyltransferase-like isoleucine patch superfamily enzyme
MHIEWSKFCKSWNDITARGLDKPRSSCRVIRFLMWHEQGLRSKAKERCACAKGGKMRACSENVPEFIDSGIRSVRFGEGVKIVRPVNLYGCTIEDGCFVGPFVEIQSGAIVKARSRIQSHAFICELVTIGEDCFVGHGVMFINDPFSIGGPARGRRDLYRPTRVGNRVSIGSNATLLPVDVCDDVVIGAGAVVTHDINQSGVYAGNPARVMRSF